MAILAGDSETTKGKPVLKSTEKDNVFIYFSDHGGVGILCMIDGDLASLNIKSFQFLILLLGFC